MKVTEHTPAAYARIERQRDAAKAEAMKDLSNRAAVQKWLDLEYRVTSNTVKPDARQRPDNAY